MYKFHHRFYRDVQPFRDTVPFPEKLQCIMMIKVISALENGKTCHRYYSHSSLPQKNFTKNIIVTTVTYTLRSIKKNLTHLHKVYHNNSLLDFRCKGGGQLLPNEWELWREKIHKNEISLSDTQQHRKVFAITYQMLKFISW